MATPREMAELRETRIYSFLTLVSGAVAVSGRTGSALHHPAAGSHSEYDVNGATLELCVTEVPVLYLCNSDLMPLTSPFK